MIAYAELFALDPTSFYKAAEQYRYHSRAFFFDGWEEIYTTDSERKISFDAARRFGESVRSIYQALGYELVNVPFLPIQERASFILERLYASGKSLP